MFWICGQDGSWTAKSRVKDPDGLRCNWDIKVCDDGTFECEIDHPDVPKKPCFETLVAAQNYCEKKEQDLIELAEI